jgi:excisionase family DNA binding protein
VHPSSIYRLLRVEGIPAFRVGSDWRFRRDLVAEWVRSKTVTVGTTR